MVTGVQTCALPICAADVKTISPISLINPIFSASSINCNGGNKPWATVFTKNRERLIEHKAIIELFEQLLATARERDYRSGEHFSVDGTLIRA